VSIDVVAEFLDRRAADDVEGCLELVADRAIWHSPVGPAMHGPTGFRQALQEAYADTRWFATETLGIRPHGDRFVGQVRNRGERGGEVLDSEQLLVFRVADGRIIEVEIHVDDPAAVAEFWAD
jgi:ketosteroid isomerase-like protein